MGWRDSVGQVMGDERAAGRRTLAGFYQPSATSARSAGMITCTPYTGREHFPYKGRSRNYFRAIASECVKHVSSLLSLAYNISMPS